MRSPIWLPVVLSLVLIPAASSADAPRFEEAVLAAILQDKPLVVELTASYCVPCQALGAALKGPEGRAALDGVVFVSVDTETAAGELIMDQLGQDRLPALLLVGALGQVRDRLVGRVAVERALTWITEAKLRSVPLDRLLAQAAQPDASLHLVFVAARRLAELDRDDEADPLFRRARKTRDPSLLADIAWIEARHSAQSVIKRAKRQMATDALESDPVGPTGRFALDWLHSMPNPPAPLLESSVFARVRAWTEAHERGEPARPSEVVGLLHHALALRSPKAVRAASAAFAPHAMTPDDCELMADAALVLGDPKSASTWAEMGTTRAVGHDVKHAKRTAKRVANGEVGDYAPQGVYGNEPWRGCYGAGCGSLRIGIRSELRDQVRARCRAGLAAGGSLRGWVRLDFQTETVETIVPPTMTAITRACVQRVAESVLRRSAFNALYPSPTMTIEFRDGIRGSGLPEHGPAGRLGATCCPTLGEGRGAYTADLELGAGPPRLHWHALLPEPFTSCVEGAVSELRDDPVVRGMAVRCGVPAPYRSPLTGSEPGGPGNRALLDHVAAVGGVAVIAEPQEVIPFETSDDIFEWSSLQAAGLPIVRTGGAMYWQWYVRWPSYDQPRAILLRADGRVELAWQPTTPDGLSDFARDARFLALGLDALEARLARRYEKEAALTLGIALGRLGRYDEALRLLSRVLRTGEPDERVRARWYDTLFNAERTSRGLLVPAAEARVRAHPKSEEALEAVRYLGGLPNPPLAELARTAVIRIRAVPEDLHHVAWLLMEAGALGVGEALVTQSPSIDGGRTAEYLGAEIQLRLGHAEAAQPLVAALVEAASSQGSDALEGLEPFLEGQPGSDAVRSARADGDLGLDPQSDHSSGDGAAVSMARGLSTAVNRACATLLPFDTTTDVHLRRDDQGALLVSVMPWVSDAVDACVRQVGIGALLERHGSSVTLERPAAGFDLDRFDDEVTSRCCPLTQSNEITAIVQIGLGPVEVQPLHGDPLTTPSASCLADALADVRSVDPLIRTVSIGCVCSD